MRREQGLRAGHQFGHYSPRLGDGRALLLGELTSPDGRLHDLHLKGSGRTPFARGTADGQAVLGPMLREYVVSEAMHALGVPTTRALAVVATVSVLFSIVFMGELGLRPSYMSILRISLVAMVFYSSAIFCFVFLLYLDLRRQALVIVAVYAVLNGLLTMTFLGAGQAFYGYGSMIAATITFVLAFAVLLRELPWLHYHAFVTNNSSL